MSSKCILVVEDDSAIREGLVDALRFAGYEVLEAATGKEGLSRGLQGNFDLMLLDLILPELGGFEILRQVRQARATLPVIILTARGQEADRVEGLRLGADDYVVKPFSVREVLARVEAVLRRSPERPSRLTQLKINGATIDFSRLEIRHSNGKRAELSERESDLLKYLAENSGRAISRDELLTRVWRLNPKHIETRTIDMHIAHLREKLGDDADEPSLLLTVRGKGYMFRHQT